MLLTFVDCGVPLVKTISSTGTDPYPLRKDLTSTTETVNNILDFHAQLVTHASLGHALMKGPFIRPLANESRSDATDRLAPTEWLCLDFDGLQAPLADVLKDIGLDDVSYVIQYSASQGFKPGLYAHIFMMLDAPITPQELKRWLQWQNMSAESLKNLTVLNKSGYALKYPLDVVTADNSRLLFIAPPVIMPPLIDPFQGKPRIDFVRKAMDTARLHNIPKEHDLRARITARIKALTPPGIANPVSITWRHSAELNEHIAVPNQPSKVTGIKRDADKDFVYVNLNGGDSWGYYYRKSDPTFLFNFKGEPTYLLRDVAPELVEYGKQEVFVDYDREGFLLYDQGVMLQQSSWVGICAVCNSLKMAHPDKRLLRTLRQTYIPFKDPGFYQTPQFVGFNRFTMPDIPASEGPWPVIEATIRHICVDEITYEYFMNWLAYVFQNRRKSKTAWVFTGVPGTGKGVVVDSVIKPLIGESNLVTVSKDVLEGQFNPYVKDNLFVVYDEAKFSPSTDKRIDNKLKILITSESIQVNDKNTKHGMQESYSNVLITSNEHEVIRIAPDDRRFNVAPRQEKTILQVYPDYQDMYELIPNELGHFKHYLMTIPVNVRKATNILRNRARDKMIAMNAPIRDLIGSHLRNGDKEYFLSAVVQPALAGQYMMLQQQYNQIMDRVKCEQVSQLTAADVSVILNLLTGTDNKFAKNLQILSQIGLDSEESRRIVWR